MKKISRNAKCPCGSGSKYKSCCEKLSAERRQLARLRRRNRDVMAELESLMARKLLLWYSEALNVAPLDEPLFDADQLEECEELLILWAAYDAGEPDGPSLLEAHLDAFLETNGDGRGGLVGEFLAAQRLAVPGIWEILAVRPNAGAVVRERLSGTQFEVMDPQLSREYAQHDHIVGKVVALEHYNLFTGVYPRRFSHVDAEVMLEWVREVIDERLPHAGAGLTPEQLRRPWVKSLLYRRAADMSQVIQRRG